MAYNSGVRLAGLAGIVGAGVGGYLGYNQAMAMDGSISPIQGALIMGAVGMVAGSAGAFILKSLAQFIVYLILIGLLGYIFRDTIEAMTGVNPVDAVMTTLRGWGLPV